MFLIRRGGILFPVQVAAPRHTDVGLIVGSADAKTVHTFVLLTPHRVRFRISAGPKRILLHGLPNGTYPILLDGVRRGRLVVGATPGP